MSPWFKITAEIEADRRGLVGHERDAFVAGCLYAVERVQEFSQYPDNKLREQVRAFEDVPSLHDVVLAHFRKKS